MRLRAAGVLAAAVAAAWACHKAPKEEIETETAVEVEVKPARVDTMRAVITATGTVEPAPGADWTITAPAPARIAEMPKAEGDAVRAGDLLVRFDAPTLRSDVATRSGELAQAQARLENARKNYARLSTLLERGIAAKKEVEDARREVEEATAAVRESTNTRGAAADLAGRAIVRARFSGVVAHRWHNPGDLVDASASDPVLRVIDPSRLQVQAQVPVGELPRITVGSPARVTVPGAPADLAAPAKVVSRPAAVDVASGTATVRLSVSGSKLAAGTPVTAEILAEEHKDVVVVPAAAVLHEEDKTYVFVVGPDKKAHRKEVTVGIVAGEDAEIRSGIAVSEQVVVRGHEELPDGAAVTVAADEAEAASAAGSTPAERAGGPGGRGAASPSSMKPQ
ncbi:MAG TPA: efflux RND transporter periplasmic adaptor subunit [Vicinamibacteria bacterium]|jgi:RND family efflux transporter MFP subunit